MKYQARPPFGSCVGYFFCQITSFGKSSACYMRLAVLLGTLDCLDDSLILVIQAGLCELITPTRRHVSPANTPVIGQPSNLRLLLSLQRWCRQWNKHLCCRMLAILRTHSSPLQIIHFGQLLIRLGPCTIWWDLL